MEHHLLFCRTEDDLTRSKVAVTAMHEKYRKSIRDESGFTLLETLVATGLALFIGVGAARLLLGTKVTVDSQEEFLSRATPIPRIAARSGASDDPTALASARLAR